MYLYERSPESLGFEFIDMNKEDKYISGKYILEKKEDDITDDWGRKTSK